MIDVETTQFSECGFYRYTLRRDTLGGYGAKVCFVMLNPSTADDVFDDPTTRRAMGFASRLDCSKYLAVNLFALRSTNPKGLKSVDDPVGFDNDEYVAAAAEWADSLVVAWGAGGTFMERDKRTLEIIRQHSRFPILCLGKTMHGHPRFPLYLRKDTAFEQFTNARH